MNKKTKLKYKVNKKVLTLKTNKGNHNKNKLTLKNKHKTRKTIKNGKQDGGFIGYIIDWVTLKYRLRQFKSFLIKFRAEEKNIQKYIDSYKGKTTTFKQLAEDKALQVTLYIVNFRQKIIWEFLEENEDEVDIETSDAKETLETIKIRLIGIDKSIIAYEKIQKDEIPKFIDYNNKFKSDSNNFLKLTDYFEKTLRGYYRYIQQIRKNHDTYSKEKHIDNDSKQKIKKYENFKNDIEIILGFKDQDIANMIETRGKIVDILAKGKHFAEEFKSMKAENYSAILDDWKDNYESIYTNFIPMNKNLEEIIKYVEELENHFQNVHNELNVIYISQPKKNQSIIDNIKDITNSFKNILKVLNIFKKNITQLKIILLNELPCENIRLDLTYIEGGFKNIQSKLQSYAKGLQNDLSNLNKLGGVKVLGGGAIIVSTGGASHSKKKINPKSGASPSDSPSSKNKGRSTTSTSVPTHKGTTSNNLEDCDYKQFFDLTIDEFDTKQKKLLVDFSKSKKTIEILNYTQTLFNIYIFLFHYNIYRNNTKTDIEENKLEILDFMKLIWILNTINKVSEDVDTYAKIIQNYKKTIIAVMKNIIDYFVIEIKEYKRKYNIKKLKDLIIFIKKNTIGYQPLGTGDYEKLDKSVPEDIDYVSLLIYKIVEDPNPAKLNNCNPILDIDNIKKNTFVKYFLQHDKDSFEQTIYDPCTQFLASEIKNDKKFTIIIMNILGITDISEASAGINTINDLLNMPPVEEEEEEEEEEDEEGEEDASSKSNSNSNSTATNTKKNSNKSSSETLVTSKELKKLLLSSSLSSSHSSKPTSSLSYTNQFLISIGDIESPPPANITKNLFNIKTNITESIDIIEKKLKDSLFNSITKNINNITKNITKLKLIEPKLLTSKIKDYNKIVIRYDWLRDYVLKDNLQVEIKGTREIHDLLDKIKSPSSMSVKSTILSDSDMKEIIYKLHLKSIDNLKLDFTNTNNAKQFIKILDKMYPEPVDHNTGKQKYTILNNLMETKNVADEIRIERRKYENFKQHQSGHRQQHGQHRQQYGQSRQ